MFILILKYSINQLGYIVRQRPKRVRIVYGFDTSLEITAQFVRDAHIAIALRVT